MDIVWKVGRALAYPYTYSELYPAFCEALSTPTEVSWCLGHAAAHSSEDIEPVIIACSSYECTTYSRTLTKWRKHLHLFCINQH